MLDVMRDSRDCGLGRERRARRLLYVRGLAEEARLRRDSWQSLSAWASLRDGRSGVSSYG